LAQRAFAFASTSLFVTRDIARALECNIDQSEADLIGG
jgi:hypothetical protein